MTKVKKIAVEADASEQRLDRWLKRQIPALSQIIIEKMCRKGELRIDSCRARPSTRLKLGQVVRIPPLSETKKKAPKKSIYLAAKQVELIKSTVIFKDDDIIVINKPSGLAVQGGSGQRNNHVDAMLVALQEESYEKPRLVHRLDKDTSGILLVARSRKAADKLTNSFKQRKVTKMYWALVSGNLPEPSGTIKYSLSRKKGRGLGDKMICVQPNEVNRFTDAKSAQTDYVVIETIPKLFSWIGLLPVTGRTHQLRAHMAAIACPIIGDKKYGNTDTLKKTEKPTRNISEIGQEKLHLHARSISFTHPIKGNDVFFEAELPSHMLKTWGVFGWEQKSAPKNPFNEY